MQRGQPEGLWVPHGRSIGGIDNIHVQAEVHPLRELFQGAKDPLQALVQDAEGGNGLQTHLPGRLGFLLGVRADAHHQHAVHAHVLRHPPGDACVAVLVIQIGLAKVHVGIQDDESRTAMRPDTGRRDGMLATEHDRGPSGHDLLPGK